MQFIYFSVFFVTQYKKIQYDREKAATPMSENITGGWQKVDGGMDGGGMTRCMGKGVNMFFVGTVLVQGHTDTVL